MSEQEQVSISDNKTARQCVGQMVYWDVPQSRQWIEPSEGILQDASGDELLIDGDWKLRRALSNLRNYQGAAHLAATAPEA